MGYIASKLKEIRKRTSLSQEKLCEIIDFHRTNYLVIEQGKRLPPKTLLEKLSANPIFEVTYSELFALYLLDKYGEKSIKDAFIASHGSVDKAIEAILQEKKP